MRLRKISITGFRSFKKTEEFLLDDRVNILIGANDHGKTNLLEAIKCLNDDRPITEEDKNWDLENNEVPYIRWHFSIDPNQLSEFRTSALKEGDLGGDVAFPVNAENEIVFAREGINSPVRIASAPLGIPGSREPELLSLRPRIELFVPPRSNVVDRVNLTELMTPQYEFMQGMFMLAGIWERRDTIFLENDINSKLLDEASERLTKVLRSDWNQGKDLIWRLKQLGTNGDHIEIKIEDPAVHNRYSRPSLRSSGFQSYFLISMIILARTKNSRQKYIFLFDEPGTYLHPKAQLDLQRTFEIISEDTQIFYTTHSLFLINKNYPERNRVVSKTKDGTKIDQKPFQRNWKAVRDSLGILLSNNFLIADKTLLVEGPSDMIYILSAIKKLKMDKKIDIDLNDISFVDAGDRDNYLAMAKLMLSEGRDVMALVDGDKWGEETIIRLKKICEKEELEGHLTHEMLPAMKSAEDVFADLITLRKAITSVAGTMVYDGVRRYKVDKKEIEIEKIIAGIDKSERQTLGRTIDDVTKTLFEEGEKLSKLSIALCYEDLIQGKYKQMQLSADAEQHIKTIAQNLSLRSERSTEAGVFQEL